MKMKEVWMWIAVVLMMLLIANVDAGAQTQMFGGPVSQVGAHLQLSPSRASLDLGETWSDSTARNRVEIGVVALVQRHVRVGYALTPGFSHSASTVPIGSFLVKGTELGKDSKKNSQDTPKPITLDWKIRPEHRLEAELMWTVCPIRPCVTVDWYHVTLDAATEKDGKQLTANDEWRKGFVGFGGLLQYEITNVRVSVKVVAGRDYSRAEGVILYGIGSDTALSLGYFQESKDPGGVRLREQGPVIGIVFLF